MILARAAGYHDQSDQHPQQPREIHNSHLEV